MIRGMYRIHSLDSRPDDVRVDDGGIEAPLEESIYIARGYLPLVDDLLWQEEYFTSERPKDDAANASTEKAARERARQEFVARFRKP